MSGSKCYLVTLLLKPRKRIASVLTKINRGLLSPEVHTIQDPQTMASAIETRKKGLERLGREIYLLISRLLNPLDIISLGQVS